MPKVIVQSLNQVDSQDVILLNDHIRKHLNPYVPFCVIFLCILHCASVLFFHFFVKNNPSHNENYVNYENYENYKYNVLEPYNYTQLTYTFVHQNIEDIGETLVLLSVFGTLFEIRFGFLRTFFFYFICSFYGALSCFILFDEYSIRENVTVYSGISTVYGYMSFYVIYILIHKYREFCILFKLLSVALLVIGHLYFSRTLPVLEFDSLKALMLGGVVSGSIWGTFFTLESFRVYNQYRINKLKLFCVQSTLVLFGLGYGLIPLCLSIENVSN